MPNPKRTTLLALVLVLALTGGACATKNLTPVQNAQFKLNQAVALVAQANDAMAQAVIALNGQQVIPTELAAELLSYNVSVALAVRSSVAILKQPNTDWATQAKGVLGVLQNLKLPPKATAWLNDPNVSQAARGVIDLVRGLEIAITAAIQAAG